MIDFVYAQNAITYSYAPFYRCLITWTQQHTIINPSFGNDIRAIAFVCDCFCMHRKLLLELQMHLVHAFFLLQIQKKIWAYCSSIENSGDLPSGWKTRNSTIFLCIFFFVVFEFFQLISAGGSWAMQENQINQSGKFHIFFLFIALDCRCVLPNCTIRWNRHIRHRKRAKWLYNFMILSVCHGFLQHTKKK